MTTNNQISVVDFTYHDPDSTIMPAQFVALLRPIFKKWTFQLEAGTLNDGRHFQGRGSAYHKKRLHDLVKLCHDTGLPKIHLSPSSKNSLKGDAFYCMKADTRLEGPFDDRTWTEPEFVPYQLEGLLEKLYPWQQQIIDSRTERNPRKVNMIIDLKGGQGKSTLASLARLHYGALLLPPVTDHTELLQAACGVLRAKEERDPGLVFVDLPRQLTKDHKRFGPFMIAIEQIKSGVVTDLRYQYKEWWFHSPSVWIFANNAPNPYAMSKDRWCFYAIVDNALEELSYIKVVHMYNEEKSSR